MSESGPKASLAPVVVAILSIVSLSLLIFGSQRIDSAWMPQGPSGAQ